MRRRLITNISGKNRPTIPDGYQIAQKIKSNQLASVLIIENASVRDLQFFPTWSENELNVQILKKDEEKSDVSLDFDDDSIVRLQNLDKDSIVRVFFPQFYGLDVSLNAGSITTYDKIEAKCGFVSLHTKSGDLSVKKIRTEQIDLRAGRVEINAVAEGTVHAECESIEAKQILGPYSKILSSNDVDIASLYCAKSDIGSMNGHVRIGTLQGSSKIRNAVGDVRVDSAVGELDIVSDDGDVLVHLDKCIQGAKHNLSASTGRVEITAATPCNARADFSIFPDCDGEIVCDTNDALTTESRTEFHAENASSESLLGVISDSGASSSQKTTGKISEAGRDMAALMSAGGDVDSNEICLLQVTASRGIEFKTKSWREMMEERMRMFSSSST